MKGCIDEGGVLMKGVIDDWEGGAFGGESCFPKARVVWGDATKMGR